MFRWSDRTPWDWYNQGGLAKQKRLRRDPAKQEIARSAWPTRTAIRGILANVTKRTIQVEKKQTEYYRGVSKNQDNRPEDIKKLTTNFEKVTV